MSRLRTIRSLERRAATLKRSAEDMMAVAMSEFGPEWTTNGLVGGDNLTDAIDNVIYQSESLVSILELAGRLAKRTAKPAGEGKT